VAEYLPISLAALMMARVCDPHDPYTPHPVGADRIRQWAGRIRQWAHRYPSDLHPNAGDDGRLRYNMAELVIIAQRAGLTRDQSGL
jgi:hypothetical protein